MASASRRIPSVRPASTEEIECWTQAASKLTTLSQVVASTATSDTLARVNRLLSAWPINDELPPEGLDGLRSMARKLETGMQEIKKNAENEAKMIEEASERISVLIALRQATEGGSMNDKRIKRPRAESGTTGTPSPAPHAGRPVITLPARPTPQPVKPRRDNAPQEGQRVAAFQETSQTWIIAVITRIITTDRKAISYEVVDADDEVGNQSERLTVTSRSLLSLPDPQSPPPEHAVGSKVLALYPETTCLYRGIVVRHWRDVPSTTGGKYYEIVFEEDDEQRRPVDAYQVVKDPGAV